MVAVRCSEMACACSMYSFQAIYDYLADDEGSLIVKSGLRKVRGERKNEKAVMRKLSDPLGSCSSIFPPNISQGEVCISVEI